MKKILLLASVATLFGAGQMFAQEDASLLDAPCQTNYYTTRTSNYFLEVGAGIDAPITEDKSHHMTASYGVGVGKWFSPYFAWRLEAFGGSMHWNAGKGINHAKMASANVDIMWDFLATACGPSNNRVFSIVPFVGLGYTYAWDYKYLQYVNDYGDNGKPRDNQSLFPVSAGLQLRFRLSKYVDFFAQARAQAYSDDFNGINAGRPVDINLTALGGFTFNLGGSNFRSFNPCDYTDYINNLNDQVNALRGELATTAAALAAANAQLPCPEVVEQVIVEEGPAPLLATVRFRIDSARISKEEKVNVFNVAEWLKANPEQNILVTGYADKDTGTSAYNMKLSERRAKAVADMLINEYGINANRVATAAQGSDVQPYAVNNWNRIVVFTAQ